MLRIVTLVTRHLLIVIIIVMFMYKNTGISLYGHRPQGSDNIITVDVRTEHDPVHGRSICRYICRSNTHQQRMMSTSSTSLAQFCRDEFRRPVQQNCWRRSLFEGPERLRERAPRGVHDAGSVEAKGVQQRPERRGDRIRVLHGRGQRGRPCVREGTRNGAQRGLLELDRRGQLVKEKKGRKKGRKKGGVIRM